MVTVRPRETRGAAGIKALALRRPARKQKAVFMVLIRGLV
jgi:hypothetical protein